MLLATLRIFSLSKVMCIQSFWNCNRQIYTWSIGLFIQVNNVSYSEKSHTIKYFVIGYLIHQKFSNRENVVNLISHKSLSHESDYMYKERGMLFSSPFLIFGISMVFLLCIRSFKVLGSPHFV